MVNPPYIEYEFHRVMRCLKNVFEHAVMMAPLDAIITRCSHTFTLFCSRKASVIAEIYQISVCLCELSSDDLFIF